MTKRVFHSSGGQFSDWLRNNPRLDSTRQSLSVMDRDYLFHKFATNVDGCGSRKVHLGLHLEVKCNGRLPDYAQHENLWLWHQLWSTVGRRTPEDVEGNRSPLHRLKTLRGVQVVCWDFGYSVLVLNGLVPEPGMRYLRFGDSQDFVERELSSVEDLEKILSFEVRPDNPEKKLCLARHHKTHVWEVEEPFPFGGSIPIRRRITKRS